MTFGIDISGFQTGLDLVRAKAEGVEFVIVKAVAAYKPEHTVADGYRSNIDRTIVADMPKGHYLIPNSRNTPAQSAEFMGANLYRYDRGDVLALDNEPLDSYPVYWRDSDAAAFFRRLHEVTGHPYERMWLYCPASLTRANGPWPECAALGVKFWWSAYGSYPTGQTPDHEPSLQGSIPRWDVHQFSSLSRVAGSPVDGNYSPHSITELFGEVPPMTMEDQMRQFIAANRKPADAATWDQMCGSLMFRFNSWRGWTRTPMRDISSAYRVAVGSGPLSTDFSRAPVGAWHYFDIAGPGNGHVMQDARGGGLVCLSTGYALSESLGNAIGFQSVPGYVSAKGARYMGWATNYAGGTISTAGLAGGGGTIIEEFLMALTDAQQAELYTAVMNLQGYVWKGGDSVNRGIGDPGTVFGRVFNMDRQLTGANGQYVGTNAIARLAEIQGKVGTGGIDIGTLAAQISQNIITALQGEGGVSGITEGQVEAAVRRVFASAAE